MFNNFGTNGNGGMNYTGMAGQPIQKPRMINPITDEERKALRQNPADEFNLNISPEEAAEGFVRISQKCIVQLRRGRKGTEPHFPGYRFR